MKHWSRTRRISLAIHVLFVSVPFFASSVSALLLWQALFNSWWLAVPMMLVIDVLALTGLILTIARIPSPFVPLRHVLPFISIIPLGRELYLLLQHNSTAIAGAVTIAVTALFVAIAWQCFGTIERLFVSPVEAARERAQEQLAGLTVQLAQLTEANEMVGDFVTAWKEHQGTAIAVTALAPALLDDSKTARVRALAQEQGVSESTIWRKIRKGELSLNEPQEN